MMLKSQTMWQLPSAQMMHCWQPHVRFGAASCLGLPSIPGSLTGVGSPTIAQDFAKRILSFTRRDEQLNRFTDCLSTKAIGSLAEVARGYVGRTRIMK